jgi:hypothetical protein
MLDSAAMHATVALIIERGGRNDFVLTLRHTPTNFCSELVNDDEKMEHDNSTKKWIMSFEVGTRISAGFGEIDEKSSLVRI